MTRPSRQRCLATPPAPNCPKRLSSATTVSDRPQRPSSATVLNDCPQRRASQRPCLTRCGVFRCVEVPWRRREHNSKQVAQRVGEANVGQLVANPTALGHCHHQPAVTEAGEMIRHTLARNPQQSGEFARIGGSTRQLYQNPGARRVGQRVSEPREGRSRDKSLHTLDNTAVALFSAGCTI